MQLSPARYVIHIFGGVRATGRAIGRNPGAIVRWKKPVSEGGSGGHIPSAAQRLILAVAKKKHLEITPADLVYGRKIVAL